MKNIQKLLWLLVLCLAASLYAANWNGSTREPESTKKIDGKVFYVITSAEELAWFAAQVNAGKTSINAQLANDIKFMDDTSKTSSVNWTPIGKNNSYAFSGIFDGAGRTIYGLYSSQHKFAGLFGVIDKASVVENMNLNVGKMQTTSKASDSFAGGIVAYNSGLVLECTNGGLVSFVSYYSGGIVGWNAGTVSNCINGSPVSASAPSYDYKKPYSGGIAGWNAGIVNGCSNSGSIASYAGYSYSHAHSGGIAGLNAGTVSGCTNNGSVSASTGSATTGVYSYSAGIVGKNTGSVINCMNGGSISRATYTGGIAGYLGRNSKMLNSFSVANSAKAGVTSDSYGSITNCYYDSDVLPGLSTVAPNSGLHTSDMQSNRFAWVLNTTNGTAAHSGVWSRDSVGYPIFADTIYKPIYRIIFKDDSVMSERYSNYRGLVDFPSDPETPDGIIFSGWYTDDGVKVKATTVFTKDQTVHAVYSETLRSYTVRFLDFDGSELQSSSYLYGMTPGISKVPARASTVAYDYAFSGWTPAIDTVKGPATYTALYDSSKVKYTVTFMDGSSVFATVQVPYGEAAVAPGTPSREGYKFVGWNGSLSNVTGDVTVSALFEELVYREVVIDRGDDGMDTVKVEEDEWFTLPEAPEKPGHTFTGWYGSDGKYLGKAGDTVKVSADMRIEPRYEANLYRIAFVNGSDTLQSGKVAYGTLPSYAGTTPTKASSAKYTYTFVGWEPAIDTVKGPATYTAVFDSTEILQISSSSSSEASSSSGKSSSSAASSSSSSSAVKNSSSSSEASDAIMSNLPTPTWSVTAAGRNFQIHAAPVGKSYALFDLQGKVLAKGRIESPEMTLSVPRAGSYIVRIGERSVRMNAK